MIASVFERSVSTTNKLHLVVLVANCCSEIRCEVLTPDPQWSFKLKFVTANHEMREVRVPCLPVQLNGIIDLGAKPLLADEA